MNYIDIHMRTCLRNGASMLINVSYALPLVQVVYRRMQNTSKMLHNPMIKWSVEVCHGHRVEHTFVAFVLHVLFEL